ncbi:Tex family protein [Alcanivorax quisquiliarum]|uniref:RNA-binding transcriptional accessory protein n=1 Tax=Alcanivorax quisquiliarum TaxID=2933565 RepID=A0ABT0EAF3_9GAMM|nr:Tex family protein [Alcanivorax quisquiliarum]MCK0538816.1 RNA-binding transcriptional accessory protein [Alcanivorax quisquiliarum]
MSNTQSTAIPSIEQIIATELSVQPHQVAAAVALLDEGATVPFIARYRKEATDGLDDTQLRNLEERLRYLRELAERRETILKSISEQEKLTPELEAAILAADTKTRLEDLYLPYKPKRRTRAQIAREAGLEPLADALLADPTLTPESEAANYLNPEHKIETAKDALDGAKQILMERFSENAELLTRLRTWLWEQAEIISTVADGKDKEGIKFSDYFAHREKLAGIPSHRALALFRGRNEGILHVSMALPEEMEAATPHPGEAMVAASIDWQHQQRAADDWLGETVRWTWKIKLATHLETELLGRVREMAEDEAIQVFARNLNSLLLAPPAGARATMGLDPGLRTGVKVVVVDETGKLLEHTTIFPHQPRNQWDQSLATLATLCIKHQVNLIAIGNGTASRETDKLAGELVKKLASKLALTKIIVSEAGASVYSASELAAREFPDLDVSFRGAVSIARRLQDPLAELVKIDPKSIGVGQYQHDVSQVKLARSLDAVVEDCVNAVGVDVNTASAPLLARISGLNTTIAGNIVTYREKHGAFPNREALKQVPRLGEKTFEQAAGFLRITTGDQPLDGSSVHPEAYSVVERIAAAHQRVLKDMIGDAGFLKKLKPDDYTDERFGVHTVSDILAELEKPGRDPRPEFKAAEFMEGVEDIKDLKPGMILEGAVTNVTNFGAFVDVGVHQDGLVHVSALSEKFVKDAHEVVSPGDIVKVKVLEVDLDRRRISLTMRMDDRHDDAPRSAGARQGSNNRPGGGQRGGGRHNAQGGRGKAAPASNGTFAALFAKAQQEKDSKKRSG